MGDPVTLVESTTTPIVMATPTLITAQTQDAKPQVASKNGKKAESGSGGSSFFTWFMVLALLGVWTSVAVVYFDLVDYQGVLGKLVAYDTDGDGDFDVEDAKVLLAGWGVGQERKRDGVHSDSPGYRLRRRGQPRPKARSTRDEKPTEASRKAAKRDPLTKDVGWKLREALKQQLAIIHERVEAKKIAKLALAEVRQILAREEEEKALGLRREEEEKALGLRREEVAARANERVAARMKEEEEKIEREEMEKLEKEKREEKEGEEERGKKGGEKEEKKEGEEKKAEKEDKGKGRERGKRGKEKSDKTGRK